MCLYPKLIKNPKYKPNKKNGGNVPEMKDKRVMYVPIGCKKCIECMKQRGRNWQVRLHEEVRHDNKGHFVTLTFSTQSLKELTNAIFEDNGGELIEGYDLDNAIATLAVRRFLERWRKKHKRSVKHWLVTELGHGETEHVHLHGILWTDKPEDISTIWKYGYTFKGTYLNERTVNYITKYTTKQDLKHKQYFPIVLTSAGIGRKYMTRLDAELAKFNNKGETREHYVTRQGYKLAMPIYYRNKLYSEAERELLWLQKLDKEERWVCGHRIDMKRPNATHELQELQKHYRRKSERLGYGQPNDYKQKDYERQRRNIIHLTRLNNAKRLQTLHR